MITEIHAAYMWVLTGVGLTALDIYESLPAHERAAIEMRRACTAAALTLLVCVVLAPALVFYRIWKLVK